MASIGSTKAENIVVKNDDLSRTIILSDDANIEEKSKFEKAIEDFSLEEFTNNVKTKAGDAIESVKDKATTIWNDFQKDIHMPKGVELVGMSYDTPFQKVDDVSIFDSDNIKNRQFGGDQMAFEENAEWYILVNDQIRNVMAEYFGEGDDADLEKWTAYLEGITDHGCGYIAMVNSIFDQYEGKEEEFYNTFGFNMYTVDKYGNVNYNYEGLVVEWYTYYWVDYKGWDMDKIIEKADGSSWDTYSQFDDFLKDKYNVDATVDYVNVDDTNQEDVEKMLDDGKTLTISAFNYDLYKVDKKTGEKGELYMAEGGGHAMTLIGYTDNGDMIVSSWGNEYILELDKNESNYFTVIDIDN